MKIEWLLGLTELGLNEVDQIISEGSIETPFSFAMVITIYIINSKGVYWVGKGLLFYIAVSYK
jgi:hypothetical protein